MRLSSIVFALATAASLFAGDVTLLCSNGLRAVVEEAQPAWEKKTGNKIHIEATTTAGLRQKIDAGASFDAAILTTDVTDALLKSGKLAGSAQPLARSGVGVGIRKGSAKPKIKTSAEMKAFLLSAKSVAFTGNGAARVFIDAMFEKMGIAEAMKSKVQLTGPNEASERVARGEAEVVLTLNSEIIPIEGVELVGGLPAEHQGYVAFSGALSAKPASGKDAASFLQYLASAAVTPSLTKVGMER